jgi:hypothetical protein
MATLLTLQQVRQGTGFRPGVRFAVLTAEVAEAVATLADPYTADDVGPRLTCTEAEALATVLRALGDPESAEVWLRGHAEGDEEGDDHYVSKP